MKPKSYKQREVESLGTGFSPQANRAAPGFYLSVSGLSLVIMSSAQAALVDVPGLTPLQADTAGLIQTVCVRLRDAGGVTLPDPEQRDLFLRCNELIETANENQGGTGAAIDRSLGLTNEELAAALQQMAHEEAAAPGTLATQTIDGQLTNVASRISALRMGARGFSLSGLHFNLGGQTLQASALDPSHGPEGRGGAAGDELIDWGRLGIFLNGTIGFGDRDATNQENGFDFDTRGITGGVDYRFTDNLVLGAALGYAHLDADFHTSATVSGGGVEADGYSVSAYGLYYLDNLQIDGIISYGWNDYDLKRRIFYPDQSGAPEQKGANRTAIADTDSEQVSLGIRAGYEFRRGALTYGPYARINYFNADIDGYRERGAGGLNFQVDDQNIESLTSVLGGQVSHPISQNFGILVPQAWLEWHHEFKDDSRTIEARFVNEFIPANEAGIILRARTDSPDRDFALLGLGLSSVFLEGRAQAFLNYETVLGYKDIDNHVFTAGMRLEF